VLSRAPFIAFVIVFVIVEDGPAACNCFCHVKPPGLVSGPSILADDASLAGAICEGESQPPFRGVHFTDAFALKSVFSNRSLQHRDD
jgi:hypothetical protein